MLTKSSAILKSDRSVFLIFCIVVSLLIVDDMFMWVSDLIVPVLISTPSIVLFTIITFVCMLGQYFILGFVRTKSRDISQRDLHVRLVGKIVTVVQYVLLAIVIFVVLEILLTFQYHTITLITVTAIVVVSSVGILLMFAYKLFSWFKLNKSSTIVLLYGLSFSVYATAAVITAIRNIYFLLLKDAVVNSESLVLFPYHLVEPGSFFDNLFSAYIYIDIVAFGLLITATAILLHHYSKRLGKVKFWIIVTLPLLYNASTILETAGIYTPATDAEWFYWYLYISLNATGGGILFGFAFMTIAKTIRADSTVRQYLTITAFGFILVFIADQITLVGASYPPYGIITYTFKPLAAFMIFLGLYSTAISISQDNQLRRSIKKIATQNLSLLSSIGTAQMDQEIQRTVNSMKEVVQEQEKELEEQSGIEANLEEDEMKNYLEEVMQEIGKAKKPPT